MGDMLSSKQNTEMGHVLKADAVAAKGLQDTSKEIALCRWFYLYRTDIVSFKGLSIWA